MKEHRKIHTGKGSYICTDCNKKCNSNYHLNLHRRSHTGEKPFMCPDCKKQFSSKDGMVKHRMSHTGEKPFACPDCNKKFSRMSNMKEHRIIHTGERPFACPDCDKKFIHKSNLIGHRNNKHSSEGPFACSDCNMKFKVNSALSKHRRIHTGERPFACPDCNKNYIQKCDLKRHRRVHTREKPFVCSDCNEKFLYKNALNSHIKIHTDQRSFYPTHEEQVFGSDCDDTLLCTRSINLDEHQNVLDHEREKPYICHVCEESFSQENLLRNHLEIHPDASDFLGINSFLAYFQTELFRDADHQEPVPIVVTPVVSDETNECQSVCSTSVGNCPFDVESDHEDIDTTVDSSGSSNGQGESSMEENDADLFKLYGCGICCQSFSTKEETIHCFNSH